MDLIPLQRYTGPRSLADTALDVVFGQPLRWFQRQMRRYLNRARVTADRLTKFRAREREQMRMLARGVTPNLPLGLTSRLLYGMNPQDLMQRQQEQANAWAVSRFGSGFLTPGFLTRERERDSHWWADQDVDEMMGRFHGRR